ncbi:MAG: transglutaminase family protein [Boseongicola sp.]|nr:MAG: transglutaminase family protein [Boseongicola sp.]
MRLAVNHKTSYAFDPPARGVAQSLRLWPSRFEGQSVTKWDVAIDGAVRGAGFRDGAGDWIETATMRGPVDKVVVEVSGTVETADLSGVLRGHRERISPLVYLRTTEFTASNADIRALANDAIASENDPLGRAHSLSHVITEAIEYIPNETDQGTTATEAVRAGKGVCQDHAHALIAAAISVDIPARYVTGYLHASGDIASASHAWAELFVENLGWVGFDASNNMCPDARYIRLGSGFDSEDAAPIRGVTQGFAAEALSVDVSVIEAAQ